MLRGKHGLAKYPGRWSPDHKANGVNEHKTNGVNGDGSGNKRKRDSVENGLGRNGTDGAKKPAPASISPTTPPEDVMLQPYRYVTSLPSKGFREKAIESINKWLRVPPKSVDAIQEVVRMLHNASLMLDDIEDNSPLRRGRPSTHNIYGTSQTINSATFQYIAATDLASRLPNPESFRVFLDEARLLHLGQSYDLYWTHNTLCPRVADYLEMVDMKTGGLFRTLTRMMTAESPVGGDKLPSGGLDLFSCLFGRYFQIRDDYQNLASADYAKAKGFAEDLDEGKYSFALIHCIQRKQSVFPLQCRSCYSPIREDLSPTLRRA
ncbi:isoprenoid synthase domain-containing protein [Colletotrichum navitas]|uniref:Isoprenoid synthase domain-containing protein n=1 Tax=Colletotrichum navitas TaxID=681940 RepID=A0AAD8PLC8_9PEZI|nr:isoprenoid synthase domain-containing protein [Colletotrichum navitas]KAK1569394.1 isoprenoid synthase domain-containing protein [Colletotrichum navitas]